uniref:Ig-like domain-containing protein n=1 Tax=Lates calcarifer TaxID=8187 RepID=A0A4W6DH27_LATCA
MMTSPKFFFCLTCLFLGKLGELYTAFISANVGDNLTLRCFYDSDAAKYYWYKQTLGQKLQPISNTYKFDKSGNFHDEFKDNPRFTLETNAGMNHLKISDVQPSDSATYYCARGYSFMFEFAEGTIVSVKESESETIQPGGSVTLNCTVHTETCDGEHSVYWFKSSEESHPGLIYTHGDRNDQCERKPNTQTHTCIYNLSLKNLNLSHAGTYYCAVASCGHILFGNGTKVDIEDEVDSLILVYFLSGGVTFTTILSVLLAFSIYKINKRNNCKCSGIQYFFMSGSSYSGSQDADHLHYAALSVNLPNRSRRQRNNTNNDCVYSSVKQ